MDDQRTQEAETGKDKDASKRASEAGAAGGSSKARPEQDFAQLAGIVGDSLTQAGSQAGEIARNAGEQAWTAAANVGSQAQDLARRVRDQGSDALYQQGNRAAEYLTRNVNEYPLPALLIAGGIGYGLAYLIHKSWLSESNSPTSEPSAEQASKRSRAD